MEKPPESQADPMIEARERILEAALPHVVFDGWSRTTLEFAIAESGVDPGVAHLAFPRGGVDMALGFHRMMDRRLAEELANDPSLATMKVREKVAHAVRRRLELVANQREAVRRGGTLLALPHHAAEGARAVWETADLIWNALGDTSTDYNWYTKRAILSSVYSATVLYWLGDDTPGHSATWAFLDRRIDEVMRFEKVKAMVANNPLAKAASYFPSKVFDALRSRRPHAPSMPDDAVGPPRPPGQGLRPSARPPRGQ